MANMECAASLDVMKLRKLVSEEQYDCGGRLLLHRRRHAHENDLTVNGGVHLHVAVAVNVVDHDDDCADVTSNKDSP